MDAAPASADGTPGRYTARHRPFGPRCRSARCACTPSFCVGFTLLLAATAGGRAMEVEGCPWQVVVSDMPPPRDVPIATCCKSPNSLRRCRAPAPPPPPARHRPSSGQGQGRPRARGAPQEDRAGADRSPEGRGGKGRRQRAENCARARSHMSSLDSGMRLSRTNEKGEREILDDKARAEENAAHAPDHLRSTAADLAWRLTPVAPIAQTSRLFRIDQQAGASASTRSPSRSACPAGATRPQMPACSASACAGDRPSSSRLARSASATVLPSRQPQRHLSHLVRRRGVDHLDRRTQRSPYTCSARCTKRSTRVSATLSNTGLSTVSSGLLANA